MINLLPGDLNKKQTLEKIIRVNHAGEYGAKRIYQGQLAVLQDSDEQILLKHMAQQEEEHLAYFTKKMQENRIRPSLLMPFWHVIGYALGKASAMLDKSSAMVTTEAIEEVINNHYQEQLQNPHVDQDMAKKIEQFRQEELEHHKIAKENTDTFNLKHKILYHFVKLGCKISIALARRF